MVTVNVKVDVNNLPNFEEKTEQIQTRSLNLITQYLIRRLAKNSPVDQRYLRQWSANEEGNISKITTPAEYARYVNDGTGIYGGSGIIRGRNGKGLSFRPNKKWTGKVQTKGKYKGFVYIPYSKGQKGQHFVETSIKETREKVEGLVVKATREAFR